MHVESLSKKNFSGIKLCLWFALLMAPLSAEMSFAVQAQVQMTDVRLWQAPDHTRLVFDLDGPVKHQITRLSNPDRLVVDIKATDLKLDLKRVELKGTPIKRIRNGRRGKNDLRLVLDLGAPAKPRSFILQANDKYGDRLVVDLYNKKKSKAKKQIKKVESMASKQRDIIVAIDAGHGGEDPGALGANKIREKYVVLSIAKKLQRLLEKEPGFKPVLIRKGDYYIGLKKRRKLAREQKADLFISIHADAFKDSRVNGGSVYVLSQSGASSIMAQFLAKQENIADLVGGVSLQNRDELLSEVLLDLSMTYKQSASLEVGHHMLASMKNVTRLHSSRVDKAAFAVLKTPDIPSVLVETGFLSNPREARNLNSKNHQNKLATAMVKGIKAYFFQNPLDGSYLAWQAKRQQPKVYVVSRGDTLSEIAQIHRVSVAKLRKHNGLKSSAIHIGQKLLFPLPRIY